MGLENSSRYSPEKGRKKQKEISGEALLAAAAMMGSAGIGITALEQQAAHTTHHSSPNYVAEAPVQAPGADSQHPKVTIDRAAGTIKVERPQNGHHQGHNVEQAEVHPENT